ncbi:zinc finger BED domain-containing protein RICESLEEPER 2-like [Quercus robur]|uniref:zinc finger BED domain-containing protein RICESLEEPER 2-like n=1 Tax=Quercus robur TaxID=38942 RepID=UPI002163D23C|nr:zinc finger BED domain-containing protein RICESLEEPER 2-like [Quercus robur]
MTSHENIGSSNPSGSNRFPLIVDEDNAIPSSPLLNMPNDVQAIQPSNEIIQEEGKYKSIVWNQFKRKRVDEKDKAECNYCKKLLVKGSNYGTKHLHDHVKICPRRKFQDIRDMNQKFLARDQNKVDSMAGVNAYNFDQKVSRNELARMIILHEYPLSIVDHIGFRKYSTSLQPLFRMVSRNTIKKDILSIYEKEREKSKHEIDKNQGRISITTYMWTSQNKKRGFIVVTAHFIDGLWRLQSRVMRFIYVPSPHTKEVFSSVLLDTLSEWNIDRKLSTVTMDNCSTNDAVIKIILDKLQRGALIMCGSMLHMRCAAHVLNLIVQDVLDVIGSCIEKVRESVGFWTTSTKRRQKFEETAQQAHVECTKELALDCESSYKCIPMEEEWEMASNICERLAVFHKVTELFSGTSYPTTNLFFPKVCGIKIALNSWFTSANDVIRSMAFKMLEKFDCYWNVIHGVMAVAIILDPRYKIELLEYYFPIIYGNEADNEIQRIRDICYEMIRDYSSRRMGKEGTRGPCVGEDLQVDDSLMDFERYLSQKKRGGNIKLELDHYLEDDLMPRIMDFDILAWWKSNEPKYPTLQRIARDILTIPVSTVASESSFSTSGRLLSPHCRKLHQKTVEALMCAQNWLWAEINGSSSTIDGIEDKFQNILDDYDDEEESGVTMMEESGDSF